AIADADRAEEYFVSRISRHKGANTVPQQQQRRESPLVFLADERSPEFKSRAKPVQEGVAKPEEGRCIQSADTIPFAHRICGRQAISANQLLRLGIPDEQMQVVPIELIDIEPLARALACPTERDLAKSAKFVQHIWNVDRPGQIYFQIAGSAQ